MNALTTRKDLRIVFILAIPLIMTGLVEASIGFTSTFFLAKLGPLMLGAGALVAWFFATMMIILWGTFNAVSVLVAHHHGAKNEKAIGRVLRDSLLLGLMLAVPTTFMIWNMAPILQLLGQKAYIVNKAIPYMHALAWGIFPDFLGLALLQFVIGLGQVKTNLFFTLLWVPLNIFLNYIFIFGKLGFPVLGIAGLGWGTTVSYWITLFLMLIYLLMLKRYRYYWQQLFNLSKPCYLWELIKVGLPTGLMFFIEVGFFFSMSLVMGHLGENELAANQLVMQYVAFFVSISFAMAQAITVRAGNQLGAKRPAAAKRAVFAGLLISVGIIFLVVVLERLFPEQLFALDLSRQHAHSSAVILLAINFLSVAIFFQFVEAARIGLFGALRGYKDTRFALFSTFIAFGCVALPLGFCFADIFALGAVAYWYGLTISAMINLSLLFIRYRYLLRKTRFA